MSENRIAFVARGPAVITGRHYKISWGKPAKGTFPLPLSLFAPPSLLPTISFSLTPGQQPALSVPGFVHPPVVTARIRIFSVDRRYFFAVIPLTLSLSSPPPYIRMPDHTIFLDSSVFPPRFSFSPPLDAIGSPPSLSLSRFLCRLNPFSRKTAGRELGIFAGKNWRAIGRKEEGEREEGKGRLWCGSKRGWGGKPEQGCDSAQFIADRIKP